MTTTQNLNNPATKWTIANCTAHVQADLDIEDLTEAEYAEVYDSLLEALEERDLARSAGFSSTGADTVQAEDRRYNMAERMATRIS